MADNLLLPEEDSSKVIGEVNEINNQNLSKKQLKRMKKKDLWLATREERKQKEREKLKQKKKAAAAAGITLPSRKRLKMCTMALSSCKQRIAIDMSFDDLMSEKDMAKCVKQIHRCYSNNRRVANPAQFYITSFDGKCLEVMEKNVGFRNWDINFVKEKYCDLFNRHDVVYLTSDSENVIEKLDVSKVYIIGGLVDHNGHKGLSYDLAKENGISHGKLPIGQYLNMKTSKVLTIDHVFQILLEVTQGKSWKDAFLTIIPARKGAIVKEEEETNCSNVTEITNNKSPSSTSQDGNIDETNGNSEMVENAL